MNRVCVNCGSSPGDRECFMEMARQLGEALVCNNYELVYGGANIGLMGQVADSVMLGGGVAIGVIPESFAHRVSHQGLTELHIVGSMHERKTMMFDLSDAFIALPGGFGTLEEMMELLTWAQLGIHKKPYGLINVDGYYDAFLLFLDTAVSTGFIKREHREMLLVATDPEDMLAQIEAYRTLYVSKWVEAKTEAQY